MTFTLANGRPLLAGLADILGKSFKFGVRMARPSWVVQNLVRDHAKAKYPGSRHWDPSRINEVRSRPAGWTNEGEVLVEVPGAGRAYHDVDIAPVNGQWLTIPLLPEARSRSARNFRGLFRPRGTNVLARKGPGGTLACLFALARRVHQAMDPALMPSDRQMASAIGSRFAKLASEELDRRCRAGA